MQDLEKKLTSLKIYVGGAWGRKRYIILSSWLICLLGWAAISTIPNQYETKARIYADTTSILRPLLHGIAVQEDSKEEVQIVSRTLKHREMLEYIATNSDLHLSAKTPEDYENLLERLKEDILISGSSKTGVYDIVYQHNDPKMAMKVVELTLKKFVDANAGRTRDDAQNATEFLEQQIEEYANKLKSSESKLAKFKRENQAHLPNNGGTYYQSLSETTQLIEDLKQQINERNAELTGLQQRFIPGGTGDTGAIDAANVSVATEYDSRLNSLKDALERLRIKYTDKHPNIIELTTSIRFLENKQAQARGDILSRAAEGALTSARVGENEALQGFALKISELKAARDVLLTRKERAEFELAELHRKLDLIPGIETTLTELTRNYQNDNTYYQQLLNRRDSAEISRSADENTQDVKFKILDEPREASKPVGPPRIIMYVGTFVLSLGVGVFFALLSSQINATISGGAHLQQLIGKNVIAGHIPHTQGQSLKRKRKFKNIVFALSLLTLLVLLAALIGHEVVFGLSPTTKWL